MEWVETKKCRRITDVAVFIDMVNDRLTEEEHKYLIWEENGKKYSFREWMLKKYSGYKIDFSEEELSHEADKLVREYRESE